MSPAKMAEPIKMLFGFWTWIGPGNHVLDEIHTPRGNFEGERGSDAAFLSDYFDHLLL